MSDPKPMLQSELKAAILAYNMNRAQLTQNAFQTGGGDAVAKLEDEFTALCNAEFALKRAEFNKQHRRYQDLMDEATRCGEELRQAITELQTTVAILDLMGKTVMLVGRLLLILAA